MTLPRLALAALFAFAAAASAKEAPAAKSQFIDKSFVTVPESVGRFTLENSEYDAEAFSVGVSTAWRAAGAPGSFTVSVYVYPLGRAQEDQAAAQEIGNVEAAIREGVKEQIYSDLTVGARTPFTVVAPEATILDDGKPKKAATFASDPKPEAATATAKSEDPLAAAIAGAMPGPNSHGWRQDFRFSRKGTAMRSMGYTFYRHLFGFKVRISVPEADMPQPEFEQLADEAARWLVPNIDVKNFGECGTITVPAADGKAPAPASGDAAANPMAMALVEGMGRIKRENCANSEGKSPDVVAPNTRRSTIVYPPGTWKHGD